MLRTGTVVWPLIAGEQAVSVLRLGLVAVALSVLGAMTATAARAETAPSFVIGGTRLTAGKTHNFAAKAYKGTSITLTNASASFKITCKALALENAVLLGSSEGSPGSAGEIAIFSECALESGNGAPECKLASEALVTEPIKSEQVENVVGSKAGKQLLEEFFPVSAANGFLTVHFTGAKCTISETIVSGQTVGEVVLDNASEGAVELGQTPQERTSWLIRFPSTAITQVWLISNGTGKVQKTKETAFGETAFQEGTELVLLANGECEPEYKNWRPAP
jgi:hypothetical protein